MNRAKDLTTEQMVRTLDMIQIILWMDVDRIGDHWNQDKIWDADTLELVAESMSDVGLQPEAETEVVGMSLPFLRQGRDDMSRHELEDLVRKIREAIWYDEGDGKWDPDARIDGSDALVVAHLLEERGLKPVQK